MTDTFRENELIQNSGSEIIHCISYDYYGQRIAISTENAYIHIFDVHEGKSEKTYEWKAHSGCIWKVVWGHPEYGQILASCSEDKSVIIWEEVPCSTKRNRSVMDSSNSITERNHINLNEGRGSHHSSSSRYRTWLERAKLAESSSAILDIQFAPKHLGLQLASCSASGRIRIYALTEISNLTSWTLQHEFLAYDRQATCLAWNPNQFEDPMIAVACGDHKVRIFSYNNNTRKWNVINILEGHKSTIHSISWAPSLGRSIHIIATGSKDGTVRVWRLDPKGDGMSNGDGESTQFSVHTLACLHDHVQEVWKVEWNLTGTTLFSSGDDQTVRSYKLVRGPQGLEIQPFRIEKQKLVL